jgi:hypothetical protein
LGVFLDCLPVSVNLKAKFTIGDYAKNGSNMNQRNFWRRFGQSYSSGLQACFACSLARAAASIPTVGVLTLGLTYDPVLNGLREGLEKVGYIGGRTPEVHR